MVRVLTSIPQQPPVDKKVNYLTQYKFPSPSLTAIGVPFQMLSDLFTPISCLWHNPSENRFIRRGFVVGSEQMVAYMNPRSPEECLAYGINKPQISKNMTTMAAISPGHPHSLPTYCLTPCHLHTLPPASPFPRDR